MSHLRNSVSYPTITRAMTKPKPEPDLYPYDDAIWLKVLPAPAWTHGGPPYPQQVSRTTPGAVKYQRVKELEHD